MEFRRLDSVSPALAERFRRAPPEKRREAARIACELAASSAGLTVSQVGAALDAIRARAVEDAHLREQLENLAAQFDDEYLRLDEGGQQADGAEVLRVFSKARAASALAFGLCEDDAQLHEAIYEAVAAMEDTTELVKLVGAALGQ